MPASDHSGSPARLPKRSRATLDNTIQSKRERVKRRRSSTDIDEAGESLEVAVASKGSENSNKHGTVIVADGASLNVVEQTTSPSETWSLSGGVAGQFSNLDPILTPDEQYLFLSVETAVHVYSLATSRLFRLLEISPGDSVVGCRLSPSNQERLYIFTLSGTVSEWDWPSNKQLAHWSTYHRTISADLVYGESTDDTDPTQPVLYSLRERKDGKKEMAVTPLNEKPQSTVILETNTNIDDFSIVRRGQAIVAYGGEHLYFGIASSYQGLESSKYTWREVKLNSNLTCLDIKDGATSSQRKPRSLGSKKMPEFDLALGGADGTILIYHDALGFLGIGGGREEEKNLAPRRLHWHRDSVRAIRWSKDGNYIISGGHESVMVLWQLDTGRKQFLPHLSSPICNIVIAESGNSYAATLADNRVMVLSARELEPLATITGLQLCATPPKFPGQVMPKVPPRPRAVTAALHPKNPDQLLVTVPASHQLTQDGLALTSSPVLQTFDIRSDTHIMRQALTRTNATTLNISPEGTQILTPDIKYLGVSHDGKWMATLDSWSPHPQDVEALDLGTGINGDVRSKFEEIYLKFWRWNESSSFWELVTRIDGPHLSDQCSGHVLDLASRPQSHEFATIGSDALLRVWRPIAKQRHGLSKDDNEPVPETWKCRSTVNLSGYLESSGPTTLNSASVCFSEDGSVLAVCMQSSSTRSGLTLLIDVRGCSVRYSKNGVYSGEICAASFLGCQLIIATKRSVFVWDTVNDIVRTIDSPEVQPVSNSGSCLLAVNPKTQTFAIASKGLQKRAASKKPRKSRFSVQVYDAHSVSLLSRFNLTKEPIALLSSQHSAEYVVIDAASSVQRVSCTNKDSQVKHTDDLVKYPDSGLEGLFGRQPLGLMNKPSTPAAPGSNTRALESAGLASVFGDTPPFVLPPSRILFRDLVRALSA